jgi:hypothetical protein
MIRERALLAITAVTVASVSAAGAGERVAFNAYRALTTFDFPSTAPEGPARARRAVALRKCSDVSGRYKQTTWGVRRNTIYRVCMFQQGQVE